MNFTKAGIILNTQNYPECVEFYRDKVGLEVLFEINRGDELLTAFSLGDIYLMVEPEGKSHDGIKPIEICPTKFRFNVPDVQMESDKLRAKGVHMEVIHREWGTTAEFSDPDGNRCALRSDEGFGL